jgi:hypothetical protein
VSVRPFWLALVEALEAIERDQRAERETRWLLRGCGACGAGDDEPHRRDCPFRAWWDR